MTKYVFGVLLLGTFLISPALSSAQTTTKTWNEYFQCKGTNVAPDDYYGAVNLIGVVNLTAPDQTVVKNSTETIDLTPPSAVPANTTVEYRVWRAALKPIAGSVWNDTYATIPAILKDGPASALGFRLSQSPYTVSFKPIDLAEGLGGGLYFIQTNYDGPLGSTTINPPYKTIYVEPQGKTRPAIGNFSYNNMPTVSVTATPQGSTTKISATTNSSNVYGVEFYAILAPGTSTQRFVHLGMDATLPYEAIYDPSIPIFDSASTSNQILVAATVIDGRGLHNCDIKPANSATPAVYTPASSSSATVDLKVNGTDAAAYRLKTYEDMVLSWTTSGAVSCTLGIVSSGVKTNVALNGSKTYVAGDINNGYPRTSTYANYELLCSNGTTTSKDTVGAFPTDYTLGFNGIQNTGEPGDLIELTRNMLVLATTSVDPNISPILGQQSIGARGTITSGPVFAEGITWWNIDFVNSPDGWVPATATNAIISAKPSTTTPPPTTAPTPCAPGDLYNYTTGQACSGTTVSNPSTTTPYFPTTSTTGYTTLNSLFSTAYIVASQAASSSGSLPPKPSSQGVVLTASPTSVGVGGSVKLAWNSNGVGSCSSVDFYVPKTNSTSGTSTVFPLKTTTYWINCYTSTGTVNAFATVTVGGIGPSGPTSAPTGSTGATGGAGAVDIKVNGSDGPITLVAGQSVVFSWTSNVNTTGCAITSPQNPVINTGVTPTSPGTFFDPTHAFYPTATTTYVLTCNLVNPDRSMSSTTVTDSVTVTPATTSSPTSPPSSACTTFAVGCWVQLRGNTTLFDPSRTPTGNPSGFGFDPLTAVTIGAQLGGAVGKIVAGTTVFGFPYWSVDFISGIDGWAAQLSLSLTATPAQTTVPGQCPTFQVGCYIQLNALGMTQSIPVQGGTQSTVASTIGYQTYGSGGVITAGPLTANNITWWNVDFPSAPDGWVDQKYVYLSIMPQPYIPLFAHYPSGQQSIAKGQPIDLTWDVLYATSCTASGGWSGTKATVGKETVSPTVTTNYTLTCTGSGGTRTVTATVFVNSSVSYSAKFKLNDAVKNLSDLIVYASPDNQVIGTAPANTVGTIIGGPQSVGGKNWWNIDYSIALRFANGSSTGWGVEDSLALVTSGSASTKFKSGDRVTNPPWLHVRATPSGNIITTLSPNQLGTITGGPQYSAGYNWWQVQWDNGTNGWSAETYLKIANFSVADPSCASDPTMVNLKASVDGVTCSEDTLVITQTQVPILKWNVPPNFSNCYVSAPGLTSFYTSTSGYATLDNSVTNKIYRHSATGTQYTFTCEGTTKVSDSVTISTAP